MELPVIIQSIEQRTQNTDIKKGGTDNITKQDDYKEVAKDMESLFAYQLLKIMRETANSLSTDKKGPGYNTYMSLFDLEVSKLFAERGLGLQDAIINWMERMPDVSNENNTNNIINNEED
jgi:Rod binding domain-containing protein